MLDTQLGVLSNAHRRRLLLDLLAANPQADRTVTASDSATSAEDQTLPIAMAHVHLPQLEDHGYIQWNREEQSVEKGSQFNEIKPLLIVLKGIEDGSSDEWSD
ncbi:ArsR family transcriptional regulator [Haladaptatus sp. NG-WS-4]